MLTEYMEVEVDQEWLNRVGTAFAVAWYEDSCMKIIKRQNELDRQRDEIAEILEKSGQDESGQLEQTLCAAIGTYYSQLEAELRIEENHLFAIKSMDWVDADHEETVQSLKGHGIKTKPITRDEFENGWQRAEAGY